MDTSLANLSLNTIYTQVRNSVYLTQSTSVIAPFSFLRQEETCLASVGLAVEHLHHSPISKTGSPTSCTADTKGSWGASGSALPSRCKHWTRHWKTCTWWRTKSVPLFYIGKQTACPNPAARIKRTPCQEKWQSYDERKAQRWVRTCQQALKGETNQGWSSVRYCKEWSQLRVVAVRSHKQQEGLRMEN